MQIFVISLPEAKERRAFMADQMAALGLGFEFVDALRGKDYYGDPDCYDKEKALRIELRNMTPGEVGCALSHQKAYDILVERGLPHAFVMEDDAILSSDVPEALKRLEGRLRPYDLVTLERCDVYAPWSMEPLFERYHLARPAMIKYGSMSQAAGYVVTSEAARKIRSINRPVFVPADSWGQYVGEVRYRGVVPTLTLVRQNVSFECSTQDSQREEFTRRTPFSMLFYAFKMRTRIGRFLARTAKRLLRRAVP